MGPGVSGWYWCWWSSSMVGWLVYSWLVGGVVKLGCVVGGATSVGGWYSSGARLGVKLLSSMGWCSTRLEGTVVDKLFCVLDWSPLTRKESMVNWTVPRGGGGRGVSSSPKGWSPSSPDWSGVGWLGAESGCVVSSPQSSDNKEYLLFVFLTEAGEG